MHRLLIVGVLVPIGCASSQPPTPRVEPPPLVAVEYRSDKRTAVLEGRAPGASWVTACASPCSERLRPDAEYRVGGKNVVPSRTFYLQGPTTIHARAGYRDMHALGTVLVSVGLPLLVLGSALTFIALQNEGSSDSGAYGGPSSTFAGIGAGAGALFTVTGILARTSNSTAVDIGERTTIARFTVRF